MRYLLLTLFILFILPNSKSATISGTVTDLSNRPISGALLMTNKSRVYTVSNSDGKFNLSTNTGDTSITFSFLEYIPITKLISIADTNQVMNIQLAKYPDSLFIPSNPDFSNSQAIKIIRIAQTNRRKFLNAVHTYSCTVINKSKEFSNRTNFAEYTGFKSFAKLNANRVAVHPYVNESEISSYFEAPNKHQYVILKNNTCVLGTSLINHEQFGEYEINLYKKVSRISQFSELGFISPLASNAHRFYTFSLIGSFDENNTRICKIKVSPTRTAVGAYRGFLYLDESTGSIYAVDLYLSKNTGLQNLDSLHLVQNYLPTNDSINIPYQVKLEYSSTSYSELKKGYFTTMYTNYKVNTTNKINFKAEQILQTEPSFLKDKIKNNRQQDLPLTQLEKNDYYLHHALDSLCSTEKFIDSVEKQTNVFNVTNLLSGYSFKKSHSGFSFFIEPIYNFISFNTVQGLVLNPSLLISKRINPTARLDLGATAGYGFSNTKYFGFSSIAYHFNTRRFAKLEISAGKDVLQFNSNAISPIINTVYTLLIKDNFMKLFEKQYTQLNVQYELINGILLFAATEFADRNPLLNTTDFAFINSSKEFSSNDPQIVDNKGFAFYRNQSFHVQSALQLTPFQKYYINKEGNKLVRTSNYPSLTLFYKRAFKEVLGSDVDLDLLKMGIDGTLQWTRFGRFHYLIEGGKFVNRTSMTFMDWKYFNGNKTLYSNFSGKQFQLLDYYGSSANNTYVEVHLEQNFKSSITAKIPLFRTAKIEEILSLNFLQTNDNKQFLELGIGIQKLFFRLDYVFGFNNLVYSTSGLRFGFLF
ncbi:MAG: carboxypeptidase regulatory-like domain-containing protein [Bacteroidia bacterium]|nr:carboxypeptidase regulatory-like domain-containing protein [Bacteroidota bacterium]MBP6413503.1 carboxypeptidase regulatory-like domain-containing protein [Bacteroidia bacterium]